jgi:hypothetical protein
MEQIGKSLADGRKIEAIKIYREATGKGLKEAKEFIDRLIAELQEKDPEKYAKLSQGSGCVSAVVLCLGLAGAALAWIVGRAV